MNTTRLARLMGRLKHEPSSSLTPAPAYKLQTKPLTQHAAAPLSHRIPALSSPDHHIGTLSIDRPAPSILRDRLSNIMQGPIVVIGFARHDITKLNDIVRG